MAQFGFDVGEISAVVHLAVGAEVPVAGQALDEDRVVDVVSQATDVRIEVAALHASQQLTNMNVDTVCPSICAIGCPQL